MTFDLKKYNKKFETKSTASLIEKYPELNTTYKKKVREILRKRGISESKLPFKSRIKKKIIMGKSSTIGSAGWIKKEIGL